MSGKMASAATTRMEALRHEGLPASWIAEDLGCSTKTVQKRTRAQPDEAAAWRTVWQQIRRTPELYALHTQIAPKARRSASK